MKKKNNFLKDIFRVELKIIPFDSLNIGDYVLFNDDTIGVVYQKGTTRLHLHKFVRIKCFEVCESYASTMILNTTTILRFRHDNPSFCRLNKIIRGNTNEKQKQKKQRKKKRQKE